MSVFQSVNKGMGDNFKCVLHTKVGLKAQGLLFIYFFLFFIVIFYNIKVFLVIFVIFGAKLFSSFC